MKNPSFPDKLYPSQRNPTNYTRMDILVFFKIFTPGLWEPKEAIERQTMHRDACTRSLTLYAALILGPCEGKKGWAAPHHLVTNGGAI